MMLFPAPAAEAVTVSFRKEHGAIYERFPCVLKSELEPEDIHFRVSVTFNPPCSRSAVARTTCEAVVLPQIWR